MLITTTRLALASALVSLGVSAAPALGASSSSPAAVATAQDSVVQVIKTAGDERGAAFAVNGQGDYLTSQQVVSRSAGLRVKVPGSSRDYPARRIESDAPPGLVLIHVDGAPRFRALPFGPTVATIGQRTWVAPPKPLSSKPREGVVRIPEKLCAGKDGDGVLTLAIGRTVGINGSPVLDASGRVVGVVRATRVVTRCTAAGTIQAVSVTRAPQQLPALAPPARSDFPAVPVVGAVFGVLLALNMVLYWRRRQEAEATVEVTDVSQSPQAPAAPAYDDGLDDDDELEIALKPRPGAHQL